ncbi:MAG: hypothetical protein IKP95_12980 [Ruminococcus sp.]|nr:hypothetical protein [Ruminococcus sp.]MBR6103335.1 hypothetical protein [Ruminococcus sp.]
MKEIVAMICKLAIELYNQLIHQIDNPEGLESFSLDAESKDGYSYKITISREKTSEEKAVDDNGYTAEISPEDDADIEGVLSGMLEDDDFDEEV